MFLYGWRSSCEDNDYVKSITKIGYKQFWCSVELLWEMFLLLINKTDSESVDAIIHLWRSFWLWNEIVTRTN